MIIRGLIFLSLLMFMSRPLVGQITPPTEGTKSDITIRKTDDFTITGDGTSDYWQQTEWVPLTQRANHEEPEGLETKVKVLYSDSGLYFLFQNEDKVLSSTFQADFEELWREDVVEVFLWPDQSEPDYFEYEISPLNYELPLIVSNIDGELLSWIPFGNTYEGDRKVLHKTSVTNGTKESGASVDSWSAEFFIPFKLFHPLKNIVPEPGTTWKANFYRIDYDNGITPWSWQPFEVNFHDYKNFGTIRFE